MSRNDRFKAKPDHGIKFGTKFVQGNLCFRKFPIPCIVSKYCKGIIMINMLITTENFKK